MMKGTKATKEFVAREFVAVKIKNQNFNLTTNVSRATNSFVAFVPFAILRVKKSMNE